MSRFCRRYICCSIVILILIFMVYYRYFGRFQLDNIIVSSDEFIAVAYVLEEDDENKRHTINENHLLNLTEFSLKLQPTDEICNTNRQDLLGKISNWNEIFKWPRFLTLNQIIFIPVAILLVTSYVGHDEVRSAHRTAISSSILQKLNVLRFFLLAEIPEDENFIRQEAIDSEHEHFNDIIQGSFVEAYRNLPYKHVMGLRWASFNKCLRPIFIIKMDDDIVVNFYHLFEYLLQQKKRLMDEKNDHFLAGYVFRHVVPIRKRQNKWFVSEAEFIGKEYPDYLSGWMYVTIPRTARSLVLAASEPFMQIFWIDDTWITGILRERQHIPIDDSLNDRFSANSQFIDCCITDIQKHNYKCPFIAGPNGGDHALIKKYLQTLNTHCLQQTNDVNQDRCIERASDMPSLKETCIGADKHLLQENHGAAIVSAIRL